MRFLCSFPHSSLTQRSSVLLQEGHGNPFVIRKYKDDDEELEAAGTEEEEEEVHDMDID